MPSTAAATAGALDQPLTCLPGIGIRSAEKLAAAFGIHDLGELLRFAPRRYEAPAAQACLDEVQEGQVVRVRVWSRGTSVWRVRGRSTLRVKLEDDSGTATALYFNQPYLKDSFPEGRELLLEGRVSLKRGRVLISPRIVRAEEPEQRGLKAVYPVTEGAPAGLLPRAVAAALALGLRPPDPLPDGLRHAVGVPPLEEALRDLHRPPSLEAAEAARRRLSLGEVLARERARRARRPEQAVKPRARDERVWQRIYERIPFRLTGDQEQVLGELRADLAAGRRMTRLLHGEVGSGKTALAFALALAVAAEGGQAAILAPTEILARQHLATFRQWLQGSRLRVVGLLGDDPAARRRESLELLRHNAAAIAIGTHALYGAAVRFAELALVVLDEQHRFGVRQKAALVGKGDAPHVLTMTATPIPRTLAWAHYGALDPCVLRTRPGGSGRVRSHAATMEDWPRLAAELRPFLEAEGRIFVVVPRIDGPGGLHAHARSLLAGPWQGLPCACVHGRMPGEETAAAVESFRSGETRVLLGTTVVEVGLDLPGIPAMAVLEAQRLGLASLHQLRGRLARGPGAPEADCWFLGDADSLDRLRLLERCGDGFQVAEADLRERGPGALRGTRQHGRSDFQLFDPVRDPDLVAALRLPEVAAFLDPAR